MPCTRGTAAPAKPQRRTQRSSSTATWVPTNDLCALASREPGTDAIQITVAADWSRKFDWVERAGSWDDYVDRQNQIAQVEEVHAMRRRHAALGFQMLDAAIERVGTIDPTKLTVRETIALADFAVRIERQARGEVTAIVETFAEQKADGPTGADILTALRTHPELLDLADALDRVMLDGLDGLDG